MKTYKWFILLLLIVILPGCKPETLYYWGDYSSTLYAYKKSPDDKTLVKHKNAIQDVIAISQRKNKKVPPGVYAEMGYLMMKEGKYDLAQTYFDNEISLYPESGDFIIKLKSTLVSGGTQ